MKKLLLIPFFLFAPVFSGPQDAGLHLFGPQNKIVDFNAFNEVIGSDIIFVQDNHSFSKKNVLRGLHFQLNKPQGKLIRVCNGSIFDVAVDLRKDSETYLKWFGCELSKENRNQLWIPPGFAHGFVCLSDIAEVLYKTTEFWCAEDEHTVIWNDKTINIKWPIKDDLIISDKDKKGKEVTSFF